MPVNFEVTAWFDSYDHPAKDAMLRVREILLSDERITEAIKWKSPTFIYKGNMASLMPRTKSHVSLMFHQGALIPGEHPGLSGGGETVRYMSFDDLDEVESSRSDLLRAVRSWCEYRDE